MLNVKKWNLNGFKKKLWVVCDVVDLENRMQNVKNICCVWNVFLDKLQVTCEVKILESWIQNAKIFYFLVNGRGEFWIKKNKIASGLWCGKFGKLNANQV